MSSRARRPASALATPCLILILGAAAWLAGCAAAPDLYHIKTDYTVRDPQFVQTMGNLLGPPIIPGNLCVTYRNGDEYFPAMLDAIHAAQKTINMETFIYWNGTVGSEFADALAERAEAGVKVHVMIDWFGSILLNRGYLRRMRDAGVYVSDYHPFNLFNPGTFRHIDHRTHRKLLIIDGKIGFTGGAGLADEWRGHAQDPQHWRDNHYRVEGPVVAQLQAAFLDNWIAATGVVLDGPDYFPQLNPAGPMFAQVFKSSARGGSDTMQLLMLLSMAAAGKTVRIESAYFVPDRVTRHVMLQARRRGVKVQIIVPGPHIDETVVRNVSQGRWGDLLRGGVEIYEYQPTMFHCKLLIVDDLWVSIGSSNLDNRSFRINDEANLNVLDPQFAAEQVRIFEDDLNHSRRITLEVWEHRSIFNRFMELMGEPLGEEL